MHSKTILAAFSALLAVVSARPLCGKTRPSSVARNATAASSSGFQRRYLSKRNFAAFPDNNDDKDTFMVDQTGSAFNIVPRLDDPDADDVNSAVFRDVGSGDGFSLSYEGLIGCTSLIVMSEQGVYFTHFWETLSFGSDEDFQREVLDFLANGADEEPGYQEALAAHSGSFRDVGNLVAYVVWPVPDTDDDGNELNYQEMIDNLSFTVNSLTGTAPISVQYTPSSEEDKALGRGLYTWDPHARDSDPTRGFRYIQEYTNREERYF